MVQAISSVHEQNKCKHFQQRVLHILVESNLFYLKHIHAHIKCI